MGSGTKACGRRSVTAAGRTTASTRKPTARSSAARSSVSARTPGTGVWERFAESPALYPGVPDLLRRAKPKGQLIFEKDSWPDENDSMENALRAALVEVGSMKPADARQRLEQLEAEHGPRRGWVWARLGMCPLAERHGASGGAGQANGDDAGRRLGRRDGQAVRRRRVSGRRCGTAGAGVREERRRRCGRPGGGALRVPAVAGGHGAALPGVSGRRRLCRQSEQQEGVEATAGECILFADGLRFDIGQRLAAMAGDAASWRSPPAGAGRHCPR